MDNFEIALSLKYTEESNMARDFRKTFQMSPSDAKVMLSFLNPIEITANIIKNSQ